MNDIYTEWYAFAEKLLQLTYGIEMLERPERHVMDDMDPYEYVELIGEKYGLTRIINDV